jgi:hypothetical protein
MKTLLQNKVKFLMLIFMVLSFSAYSVPGVNSNYGKNMNVHVYKSPKVECKNHNQKYYKGLNKNKKFQKRINHSNR